MKQNRTVDEDDLTSAQILALNALIEGKAVSEAAVVADVSRTTVHRWLKDSAEFRAAYNSRRADLRAAHESKLDALLSKALTAVEAALDGGDARVAMSLLQGTGMLGGIRSVVGSGDPEVIEKAIQQRKFMDSLAW
jgi:membrane protein involved in colicin uptake